MGPEIEKGEVPEVPQEVSGSRQERIVMRADPICGNCGKPYRQHYFEKYGDKQRVYCYTNTNGDVFMDYPHEDWVLGQMGDRYPNLYEAIELEWKRANGHA